jgi:hypothetical protein
MKGLLSELATGEVVGAPIRATAVVRLRCTNLGRTKMESHQALVAGGFAEREKIRQAALLFFWNQAIGRCLGISPSPWDRKGIT